jgi:hypothetical protein
MGVDQLQIVVVFVGGAWVLVDYFEFAKANKELTNKQLALVNQTAGLTQSSIALNNQITDLKLTRSLQGDINTETDASVDRIKQFEDGTNLYSFHFSFQAKNVSESNVTIPALVVEFFIGVPPETVIKDNQGYLVNPPNSFRREVPPGSIKWTKVGTYRQVVDNPDFVSRLNLPDAQELAGNFIGEIGPQTGSHMGLTFFLRSHPDDLVAGVVTFWYSGADKQLGDQTHDRWVLLSEANEPSEKKSQNQQPE